ncbi:MAG: hypothetical protein ABEJ02_02155 [Candidatus Paceibacteria bacterium]
MFGWFSGSVDESVEVLRDTSVDNADVLYAGTRDTTTRRNLVREFNDRDLNVTDISALDIEERDGEIFIAGREASELEGKTVFYRQATFLSDINTREEKIEKQYLMYRLQEEYDINFYNSVRGAFNCWNKRRTKNILDEAYSQLENVRVAESFDSLEQVNEALERKEQEDHVAEKVVRKPEKGSLGRGIEFIDAGELGKDDFESAHHFYEECIDHSAENVREVRALDLGEGRENKVFVERDSDSGKLETKNIDQGAHYEKRDEVTEEEYRAIMAASRALDPLKEKGMEFGALDYLIVEKEEGVEVVVMEYNSTPGTKVSEFYEENIREEGDPGFYEMIADSVEESHYEFTGEYDQADGSVSMEDVEDQVAEAATV